MLTRASLLAESMSKGNGSKIIIVTLCVAVGSPLLVLICYCMFRRKRRPAEGAKIASLLDSTVISLDACGSMVRDKTIVYHAWLNFL